MQIWWLTLLVTNPAPLEESSPPAAARLFLDGQRGALDLSGDRPVLRFQVLAHNRLRVSVEAVAVGVLFAKTDEELGLVDPAAAYQQASPAAGEQIPVGAVQQWLSCELAPGGEAALTVELPLNAGHPEPLAFVTHVLGYRLGDLRVELLRELLGSEVPADEVAVVETLALTASPQRKLAVRQRWGDRQAQIAELVAMARAPAPTTPRFPDCLQRVLAIRALGVLGGDAARAALTGLAASPTLDLFDDALLVVTIARAQGSPLEAAMAHAVPANAGHLRDVVAAALADLELSPAALAAVSDPPGPVAIAPDPTAGPETNSVDSDSPRPAGHMWPWAVVAGMLVVVGWWAMRRRA